MTYGERQNWLTRFKLASEATQGQTYWQTPNQDTNSIKLVSSVFIPSNYFQTNVKEENCQSATPFFQMSKRAKSDVKDILSPTANIKFVCWNMNPSTIQHDQNADLHSPIQDFILVENVSRWMIHVIRPTKAVKDVFSSYFLSIDQYKSLSCLCDVHLLG